MGERSSSEATGTSDVVTPLGVNHVVLNVRDIEESHQFWTEIIGLKQVGTFRPPADMGPMPKMRFYSGERDGKVSHHDVALVENPNLPAPPADWEPFSSPQAINHIAITMPDRESWMTRLADLQARGSSFISVSTTA